MKGLCIGLGLQRRGGGVSGIAIANRANTTVTDLGGGVYSIEKTGGSGGVDDASAVSSVAISGDGYVRIRNMVGAADQGMIGLNTDPTTDNALASIDRAVYYGGGGTASGIYENGASLGNLSQAYDTATYFFVRRVGTTITVLTGATTNIASATLRATGTALAGDLYFDCSLIGVGSKFEVFFSA